MWKVCLYIDSRYHLLLCGMSSMGKFLVGVNLLMYNLLVKRIGI